MKIDKFIDYNHPSKIEEILSLMLNQPHVESKSSDYKPIHIKVLDEIKDHIGTVGIFGTGITAFYPIFAKLITNSGLDVTTENIVMMTICALSVVYMDESDADIENPAKLKKWIKSCLEECRLNGTYGFFKKMVEVIKSIKTLCSFLLNKCGKVANTLTDMVSYTAFFVPFVIAIGQLISNHSIDIDTLPGMFASLGLGTFTITAKHYISELISKLKLKFKKDPLKDISVTPDNSIDKFSEWKEKDMITETDLISEKQGIAVPTLEYGEIILPKVLNLFKIFNDRNSDNFDLHYTIGKQSLPITDESFKKFPVSKISVNITFKKHDIEQFADKWPNLFAKNKTFNSTGFCTFIGEDGGSELLKNNTMSLKMGVGVNINKNDFKDSDIEKVLVELESSILHELNHAYEGWNRFYSKKSTIPTALTWALDDNVTNVPKGVWAKWTELGFYIYWTESHEINAMVQDTYPYVKRYGVEDMKLQAPTWNFSNIMGSFSAKQFKKEIVDLIHKNMPDNPDKVLTGMKNGLADKLEMMMGDQKEKYASISPSLIRKMSIDQFLEYCEKRIKEQNSKIRKKILRQYSPK